MSNALIKVRDAARSTKRALLEKAAALLPLYGSWPSQVPGVPITYDLDGVISYELEGHRLILGDPGEGKGTSAFLPLLLHDVRGHNGRRAGMIVIDPKDGELVRASMHVRRRMGSPVYILDPFGLTGAMTESCNPLLLLNPAEADFFERATGLARALIGEADQTARDGVQWQTRGRELLTGILGYLACAPGEEKTLIRARSIIRGDAEEFERVCQLMAKCADAPLFVRETGNELMRLYAKAPKELQGYLSVMSQALNFVDDMRLARVLMSSSFSWAHVRESGATVYVTVPDAALAMAAPWLRLMVECGIEQIRMAQRPPAYQKRGSDVHLLIDEARAFGNWRAMEDWLRALRSEWVSVHFAFQNIAQIASVWGQGHTRMTAVKLIHFLGSNDVETCEWIAKLAGETTVIDRSHSASGSEGWSINVNQQSGHATSKQTGWSENISHARGTSKNTGTGETSGSSENWSSSYSFSTTTSKSLSSGWTHNSSSGVNYGSPNSHSRGSSNGTSGGVSTTTGHTETWSNSHGQSVHTSRTKTEGEGTSETETEGRGTSSGEGESVTEGKGLGVGQSGQKGQTTQLSERRRLLTVQEVRALDRDKAVVFVGREAGMLVRKLHFHRNPALLLRIMNASEAAH